MNDVAILMATYNGEKYVQKQINSILNQSYSDWILIIHDDNSSDSTNKIINDYKEKFPEKIIVLNDGIHFGSPQKNFFHLMKYAKENNYEYLFFCDQDDIWNKDKLKIMLDRMKIETNQNMPVVIHSDSSLINEIDQETCISYNNISKLHMEREDFFSVSLWNIAQGCSMLINRECLNYLNVNIDNIIMHDWWICSVAALFGKVIYIDKPLIQYRQHSNNYVGGQGQKRIFDILSFKKFSKYMSNLKQIYTNVYIQIMEIEKYLNKHEIEKEKYLVLKNLLKVNSKISKIKFCYKYKLFRAKGIKTCIGFILYK